jgi:hypothetical protein
VGGNGIKIIRTQKYKVMTDSNHTFNIAPNLLDQGVSPPSHAFSMHCRAEPEVGQ